MIHWVSRGSGFPILILHGNMLDHRHSMAFAEPVFQATSGWQRVYIDLPGHGKSPARDQIVTQDDLLDAVRAFVDDRFDPGPFAVVGLSRGSYLARGLIHTMPGRIAGAALIVPGGNPSSPHPLPPHQVLVANPALRQELPEEELWGFDNLLVVQSREAAEQRRKSAVPAMKLYDAAQNQRLMSAFDFSFHDCEMETPFDGPSLIVAGRQDAISGYRDAADIAHRYTRSTLAVLDTAGHALVFERPDLFNALFGDWLDLLAHALNGKR